jgi:hypothetical protein
VQIGLVVFTYMAAYGVMYLISLGLDSLGGFFTSTVKPLIWGFNFLIGTVMAILVRNVLKELTNRGRRQYLNNFMLARISGVMFDLMVVASIAAIDLSAFNHREFIIPLLTVCIVGAVATYLQLSFVSKRIYPEYPHEAFLSLYGMLTGTASTGVILLREIDPMFKNARSQQPRLPAALGNRVWFPDAAAAGPGADRTHRRSRDDQHDQRLDHTRRPCRTIHRDERYSFPARHLQKERQSVTTKSNAQASGESRRSLICGNCCNDYK